MNSIKIDLLTTDAGTQQRTLSENVVQEYAELMKDEHKFPAIDIITDGTTFWPWNGFHRLEAARRAQKKTIACAIKTGTLEEAIWLSCSANRDNGLPRTTEEKRNILLKLLSHKKWGQKSTSELARHVGVGRPFATKIRAEFEQSNHAKSEEKPAHGVIGLHDSEVTAGVTDEETSAPTAADDDAAAEAHGVTGLHHSDEVEDEQDDVAEPAHGVTGLHHIDTIEVTRGGKTYTQKKQLNPKPQTQKAVDKVGREIPHELIEVYKERPVIEKLIRSLDEIKNQVKRAFDAHDLIFSLLHYQSFQTHMENLRRDLKFAMPFAVCPYCGGRESESCDVCKGFGFVNSIIYTSAPRELKNNEQEVRDDL